MSSCNMCSAVNKKLHKRLYLEYKIYVCTKCTIEHQDQLDMEKELT